MLWWLWLPRLVVRQRGLGNESYSVSLLEFFSTDQAAVLGSSAYIAYIILIITLKWQPQHQGYRPRTHNTGWSQHYMCTYMKWWCLSSHADTSTYHRPQQGRSQGGAHGARAPLLLPKIVQEEYLEIQLSIPPSLSHHDTSLA